MTVAIPEPGADFVPLIVAQQKGYFTKLGIAVKLSVVSTPDEVPAIVSGSVNFITVSAYAIEAAWTRHLNLRLVSGIVIDPPYSLLVKPGITSLAQLKGKSIGSNGSGDFLAQLTAFYLHKLAGIPENGVTYVGLGPDPKRLAGLEAGSVDAAIFDPGFPPLAEAAGFHDLLNLSSVAHNVPVSGLVTTTGYIQSNRSTVLAVVEGMHEGMNWIKANKAAATKVYASYLGETPKEAADTYTAAVAGYNFSGVITPAEVSSDLQVSSAFAAVRTGKAINIPSPFTKADAARVLDNIGASGASG